MKLFLEIFLIIFIVMIFFFMMGSEVKCMMYKGKPNFFYDVYVDRELKTKLNETTSNDEIMDILLEETTDSHLLIWRHVVFISFTSSLLTTFVIKIINKNIDFNIFVVSFLCLFFILMLFLSLVDFHFYGSKNKFISECIFKIKNTTKKPF